MIKVIDGNEVIEFYRGRHITKNDDGTFDYYLKGEEVDGGFNDIEYLKIAIDHDMLD